MSRTKKSSPVQAYLKAMPNFPPVNAQTIQTATLKDLRPSSLTQVEVADALGNCTPDTVSRWERGIGVDGISPEQLMALSALFNRDIAEIVAAAINTKLAKGKTKSKEDDN